MHSENLPVYEVEELSVAELLVLMGLKDIPDEPAKQDRMLEQLKQCA